MGYVELIYAVQNNISYGLVRNKAGNYIEASLETATNAAAGAVAALDRNTDFRISITNPDGAQAYPISSFTWLLVPEGDDGRDQGAGRCWISSGGQPTTASSTTRRSPTRRLPARVVQLEEERLKSVTVDGKPVLPRNYRGR